MRQTQKNKTRTRWNPFCRLLILTVWLLMPSFFVKNVRAGETRHVYVKQLFDITYDFNQPTEVSASRNGHVFVLDGANDRVVVFNENGKPLYQFGKTGAMDGELKNPVGLGLDHLDNVYIADTGNNRIQVFDTRGNFIRKIDLTAWNARPVEVTPGKKTGRIYISDAANHQILCFNSNGSFNAAWGSYGKRTGEFKFPGMSAVDNKGDLFVVDILNGRIQVFNPDGKNPRQVSRLGVIAGRLFRPKGIVIDPQSRVFVSDSYTGIIQVFDPDGRLYGILSTGPAEFLRLTTPVGMAFDQNGRLYVVQSTLNTISVFQVIHEK